MLESPTSRRVDFDEAVTVEELRRTHPLRSSFLHGESIRKTSRSSTRSSNGTKTTRPGKCPVHGKKKSVVGSVPDVIIPLPIIRQNSSEESIGPDVQPIYAAPLKSALKSPNGAVLQKPQGWAGLQWALLMGCYALMLLLAVVVGVVLIQQHRQYSSADDRSGSIPTLLTAGSTNDFPNQPRRGPGVSNINNNQNLVSSNQVKETKSDSGGPPYRDLRGSPKSLSSQEFFDNSFGSQTPRKPKVISRFSNQPSSQPSLTGPQSRQPQGNQRINPSFSGNQNRGSSVSQSSTSQSSFPGVQTRGSSFPGQQTNQQTFPQQNIPNGGSSPSRSPIRPVPFPRDQTRSTSFPTTSRQIPNQPSSNNQQRSQPSSPRQNQNQPSSNNQQRSQPSRPRLNPNQPSSNNQQRSQPSLPRKNPNQPSSNNQQRSQPTHPSQRTNQPQRPGQNTRTPSSRQQRPSRPSQSNMQASQLPFNNDPAVQPRFPFEQLHRPASLDRTSAPLPSLDADSTLAGSSGIPGTDNADVKIAQLWNHQNSDGSFTYGYVNTDGSFKNETRSIGGCVEGIYGYVDPVSNQEVKVPYKTGNTSNNCNIPQAPWPPQTG